MTLRAPALIRCLAVAVLALHAGLADAQTGPRVSIWLMFAPPPDAVKQGFTQWRQQLDYGLQNTVTSMDRENTMLRGLKFMSVEAGNSPSNKDLEAKWNEANALQVMSAVSSPDAKVTVIDTRIFLGSLKGDLPSDIVLVTNRYDSKKKFAVASDSIALVVIYALAMDARRLGRKASACEFLTKAREIARELQQVKAEQKELQVAVDKSLRANCNVPGI